MRIGQRRHYLSGYPAIILDIGPDGIPEGGSSIFSLISIQQIFSKCGYLKEEPRQISNPAGFSGEPPGIRTPDPLIKSQMLCQLS